VSGAAAGLLLIIVSAGATSAPPAAGPAPAATQAERAALDRVYARLARREFAEAQAEWRPIALAVQQSLDSAASAKLDATAEAALQRRVGEVVFIQGLLEARLGRKEDALAMLRKADGYGFPPLDSPRMALAADCLLELDEPALAAKAYAEVVKARPTNADARLRLGVSLYTSGQLGAATRVLEEVLRRDPASRQAHFYLGAALFDQNRGEEASGHLRLELQRDPRCHACMAKLAHLAYLAGEDRRCEEWLGKAAALDPSYVETNLVYGMLHNRAGRPELAIEHLLRVAERAPGYAKAHYQLALAYQRSGNTEKAREQREIYDRLLAEEKARTLGVRGSSE